MTTKYSGYKSGLNKKIEKLCKILWDYSPDTFEHCKRVNEYADNLFKFTNFSKEIKEDILIGALLHDIGKVDIPIEILNKPDILTLSERKTINMHSKYSLKYVSDFPQIVQDICTKHHECIEMLPEYVQFITMIDRFDALVSERPYKKAMTKEQAISILKNEKDINEPFLYILEKHAKENSK